MKKRLPFIAIVLVSSMLACNIPSLVDPPRVKVLKVTVNPSSGSGKFTLEVTYDGGGYDIECYYTNGFRKVTLPSVTTPSMGITVRTGSLMFNETETGDYTAGCYETESDEFADVVSTSFTVTEESTSTPEPIPISTSTPTATPTSTSTSTATPTTTSMPTLILTGGTIKYDEASEQLSPHKDEYGYYPSQHHKWCNPTLSIDANGNINGTCSSTGDKIPSGLYGTWNGSPNTVIHGTITGKVIPGGSFTFREELIETGLSGTPWEYTRKVIIEGTGSLASPTMATGTAVITIECSTLDPSESGFCGDYAASDSYTGSISWEFNGTTATPSSAIIPRPPQPVSMCFVVDNFTARSPGGTPPA